jgi:hypothetical protein
LVSPETSPIHGINSLTHNLPFEQTGYFGIHGAYPPRCENNNHFRKCDGSRVTNRSAGLFTPSVEKPVNPREVEYYEPVVKSRPRPVEHYNPTCHPKPIPVPYPSPSPSPIPVTRPVCKSYSYDNYTWFLIIVIVLLVVALIHILWNKSI